MSQKSSLVQKQKQEQACQPCKGNLHDRCEKPKRVGLEGEVIICCCNNQPSKQASVHKFVPKPLPKGKNLPGRPPITPKGPPSLVKELQKDSKYHTNVNEKLKELQKYR